MAKYDIELFKEIPADEDRIDFVKNTLPLMKWSDSELVLDIGSGPGKATVGMLWPLLQNYGTTGIIGMDIDEQMVNESKQHSTDHVSFLRGDIESLESMPQDWNERFKKVFSFFVFQDIKRMRRAFDNMNWCLKEGGECCIILASYLPHTEAHLDLFKSSKWGEIAKERQLSFPCVNEIFCTNDVAASFRNLLQQCGFGVVTCYEFDRTREFKGAKDYMEFMMATDLNMNNIPENLAMEYKEQMYERLVTIPYIKKDGEVRPVIDQSGMHLQHQRILHIHAVKSSSD